MTMKAIEYVKDHAYSVAYYVSLAVTLAATVAMAVSWAKTVANVEHIDANLAELLEQK